MKRLNLTGSYGENERSATLALLPEHDLAECERQLKLETPHADFRAALALILWKTLRERSVGRPSPSDVRNVLSSVGTTARLLKAQIEPMVKHTISPRSETAASGEAAFLIHVASNGAASLDDLATLGELVDRVACAAAGAKNLSRKSGGNPGQIERHATLQQLRALAHQLNGGRLRKYTKNPAALPGDADAFSGELFMLFKTIERAAAIFAKAACPTDDALAKFIERSLSDKKARISA